MLNPIIEKLRKLLAHEKSARSIGNIEEAEAFAGKIQELLTNHKLDMSEVEFAERDAQEPVDWESVSPTDAGYKGHNKAAWQIRLARAIASCNTCQIILQHRSNSIYFVGRTSDRELCRVLFLYFLELAKDLADRSSKENKQEQRAEFMAQREDWQDFSIAKFAARMREYKKSWFAGFSRALCDRLNAAQQKATAPKAGTGAMIHLRKDLEIIKSFVDDRSQKSTSCFRPTKNSAGYQRGLETGKAVNLNTNRMRAGRPIGLLGC